MSNREEIIHKLTRSVLRYVWSKFGMTKEDSEDVVQETMLILCGERYKHLETEADLVPVAITIARLKSLEAIRGRRRYGELPENFDPANPAAGPQDHLLAEDDARRGREWLRWLRTAVQTMKEGCRRLLELRLMGLSTDQIAQELGKTQNNVLVKEHRCREKIRRMLPEGARR